MPVNSRLNLTLLLHAAGDQEEFSRRGLSVGEQENYWRQWHP